MYTIIIAVYLLATTSVTQSFRLYLFQYCVTLQKQRYEVHTEIGMISLFYTEHTINGISIGI